MDELEEQMARGKRAELLLNNPLLEEILGKIETTWTHKWKASKAEDTVLREQAYLMLSNLEEFKRELRSVLDSGKLAEATLTRRRGRPPKT
jgi:hypothetical protein